MGGGGGLVLSNLIVGAGPKSGVWEGRVHDENDANDNNNDGSMTDSQRPLC